ncbi:hypothetical protein LTR53_006083 [Teratosphaeriaceae sp. CCFEE 6253]|nr:hypothetical protein LTR53_006083 [Teratosphaeriaceae sp. CCFEE 6253]
MPKILTVFGASGNQGGSVIHAVLDDATLSKEFRIRAVTRDVSKPSVVELAKRGVDIIVADMSSGPSLADAVKDAHTVFLCVPWRCSDGSMLMVLRMTNFWEHLSADKEIAEGKAVADACKLAGVQHLIFSSLINATEASKGRLSHIAHFDGKASVEKYIRHIEVPATFVLPGLFMPGYFDTIRKRGDGGYTLALPMSEDKAQIPLLDPSADTGKFVRAIMREFPACLGKQTYAAVDYLTPRRLLAESSEVVGKPASFVRVAEETFKSFLPPPVAQELLENILLLEDPGYYAGVALEEGGPMPAKEELTTWKEFVQANKAKWL